MVRIRWGWVVLALAVLGRVDEARQQLDAIEPAVRHQGYFDVTRALKQPGPVDRAAFYAEASPDALKAVWPELVTWIDESQPSTRLR